MDSEQDIGADSAQDEAYAGAGARLRAAREARRIELTHTATLRCALPANLLRRSGFTPTLPDAQRAN